MAPFYSQSTQHTSSAPRSTAYTAMSITPTAEVSVSIIRPTSYAVSAHYCSHHQPVPPSCTDMPVIR